MSIYSISNPVINVVCDSLPEFACNKEVLLAIGLVTIVASSFFINRCMRSAHPKTVAELKEAHPTIGILKDTQESTKRDISTSSSVVVQPKILESLLLPILTLEGWLNPQIVSLPPYSQELKDFLDSPCPVWQGKKVKETHFVAPLFDEINYSPPGQVPEMFPLSDLGRLFRLEEGLGTKGLSLPLGGYMAGATRREISKCNYGVFTLSPIPESVRKKHEEQEAYLKTLGYRMPPLVETTMAILWEKNRLGTQGQWFISQLFRDRTDIRCTSSTGLSLEMGKVAAFDYRDDRFPELGTLGFKVFKC